MSSPTRKLFAPAAVAAGLVACAAFLLHPAAGQPDAKPKAKPLDALPAGGKTPLTTAVLDRPAKLDKPVDATIAELFQELSDAHKVTFRLDMAHFRRWNVPAPYDAKITIPVVRDLTVRDVLDEVIALTAGNAESPAMATGIQVRGTQVILTQKFVPPSTPRSVTFPGPLDDERAEEPGPARTSVRDLLYGPTVGLSVERKPFVEVIDQLRDASGANIVADPRVKDKLATPITLTANDARLMTVLKLASDTCEVGTAVVDNVFYVTTKENAARLMLETERNVLGGMLQEGYLTDGWQLYLKPPGLKPAEEMGLGGPKTLPKP